MTYFPKELEQEPAHRGCVAGVSLCEIDQGGSDVW